MKSLKIGKKIINQNSMPYIIAEIGVNHNGKLDLAEKLIFLAKEAGADAVKFQTFSAIWIYIWTARYVFSRMLMWQGSQWSQEIAGGRRGFGGTGNGKVRC